MRVCFVSAAHSATDKRVHYKEAVALVRAGFDVVHVVQDEGEPGVLDGVTLVKYAGGKSIAARLKQLPRLYRAARSTNADVYHCNEVDSWCVGLALKMRTGARVVFDAHEIYSGNFAQRNFSPALQPLAAGILRGIMAVAAYFTDRLVLAKASAGIDYPRSSKTRQILARNYVDLDAEPKNAAPAARTRKDCILLHLGAINRQRGWPQLLDALALTQDKTIKLRVIGRFGDNTENEFLARVRELGLEQRVQFQPWIPYEEVIAATRNCDVGLIVFQPVMLNFTHALPHKLFDYMLAALPVVAPDFTVEVSEIVRDAKCGLLIRITDPAVLASAFDELARNPALRSELGENGRKAVFDRYNWGLEARRLVAMYKEIESSFAPRQGRFRVH